MKNQYIFLLMTLILLSFASAVDTFSIPDAKQGQCTQLTQVCDNCTYVNLTAVQMSPSNNYLLSGQYAMTKLGSNYNYSFCNTSTIANYQYTTCGDLDGTNLCQTVNFKVSSTGQDGSTFYLILITALAVIFLIATLFVDEPFFVYIAGVLFLVGGVYLMINGLNVLNDTNTRYLAIVYLGIGILFTIGAYLYNEYYSDKSDYEED